MPSQRLTIYLPDYLCKRLEAVKAKSEEKYMSTVIEKVLEEYFIMTDSGQSAGLSELDLSKIDELRDSINYVRAMVDSNYRITHYVASLMNSGFNEVTVDASGETVFRPSAETKRIARKKAIRDLAKARVGELDDEDFMIDQDAKAEQFREELSQHTASVPTSEAQPSGAQQSAPAPVKSPEELKREQGERDRKAFLEQLKRH